MTVKDLIKELLEFDKDSIVQNVLDVRYTDEVVGYSNGEEHLTVEVITDDSK
jgi:hypothetical protein